MRRDWKEYNNQLIKRAELLTSLQAFGFHEQEKKRGISFTYPEFLIRTLFFIKFELRLLYRQMEGLAKGLFLSSGVKVPNFRTLQYIFSKMSISLESFPEPL